MRELLEEAREILGDCYYNGKEPLLDGTRAMIAKTIKRIDAALAAPEPDAMEIVDKLEKLLNMDQAVFPPPSSYSEAAALIESYGRRVPGAMLEEIFDNGYQAGELMGDYEDVTSETKNFEAIAAKHGVKVEG